MPTTAYLRLKMLFQFELLLRPPFLAKKLQLFCRVLWLPKKARRRSIVSLRPPGITGF